MGEIIDEVVAVHLFPIKSCQQATVNGEVITELEAGPTGLRYGEVADRGWVIADPDNLFVSQRGWNADKSRKYRDDRLLATVSVDIRPDHLGVAAPAHGEISIPLAEPHGEIDVVRIFGPDLPVIAEGEEAGEFFSGLLGRSVGLWRADPMRPRMLPKKYQRLAAANRSAGEDGRPVSLASQASLDRLHDLAGIPRGTLPLINFRANVDVRGLALGPFGEDILRQIRMGNIAAYIVKALARCPMPNFDQITGDDSQKLATRLLRPRSGWALGDDTSQRPEPYFAQSLNHVYSPVFDIPELSQRVRVGDPLTVLESRIPNVILKSEAA